MAHTIDPQWYRKIWSLDMLGQSWVEQTAREVEFVIAALDVRGGERILDLACGFGRHALALAERGHSVVGVDITADLIAEAQRRAHAARLEAQFVCADIRDITFAGEFDVVLNMADGAIGYLEDDAENLKIFDRIAAALKPGGQHLMHVVSGEYARRHFPRRNWEAGAQALALAEFEWLAESRRMLYTGWSLPYGEPLAAPQPHAPTSTRLYTQAELGAICAARGLHITRAFGDYDVTRPASEDTFALVVCSRKLEA